jgi:sugar phosphate isomerase/epimerase
MQSQWSRRGFLSVTAGVAGAAAVGMPWCSARADTDKPGRPLLGMQSYTLRNFPVDKAITMTKELGLAHIEFFPGHFSPSSSPAKIAEMKEKMAAAGLRDSANGVNPFTKNHEANRKLFEFAKQVGMKNITADPTEDSFDSLDKLVAEYDIRIAIHNHGPGARYDKIADVLKAIKGHDPRIGACADLGHYIRSAEDPVKAIMLLNDRLFGIHLKDFAEEKGNSRGVILGKGHLDLVGVYKALRKVNFPADGAFSLEYEENPGNPIPDVKECIAAARDAEGKTLA